MNLSTASLRIVLNTTPETTINKAYPTTAGAGVYVDSMMSAGYPLASSAVTIGSGLACSSSTVGATPLPTQKVGEELRLLQIRANSAMLGGVVIVDRLVATTGLNLSTTTTEQPINTTALPRYSDGAGVECFLYNTVAGAGGLAGQFVYINYTNQDGVIGRTGSVMALSSTVRIYSCQKFALQEGDTGVRSVQGVSSSATGRTGTYGVLLIKRVVSISISPMVINQTWGGASLGFPAIHPDACLNYWMMCQSTAGAVQLDMKIGSVAT